MHDWSDKVRKTKRLPRREEGRKIRQIKGKSRSDRDRNRKRKMGRPSKGGRDIEPLDALCFSPTPQPEQWAQCVFQ